MKIGNFQVPDIRLEDLLGSTLKKIYTSFKTEPIQSKDLSALLGYKYGTEPTLFKKINSMLSYGILEGRGVYTVTKLGEDLLYPESPEMEKKLKVEAIMNVELWKKIWDEYDASPPKDDLWVKIRSITEVDPETARKSANRIYMWYMEDINSIVDYLEKSPELLSKSESKEIRSSFEKEEHMKQQIALPVNISSMGRLTVPTMGTIEINDEDTLTIARSYLNVLEKKIREKKNKPQEIPEDVPISDEATENIEF